MSAAPSSTVNPTIGLHARQIIPQTEKLTDMMSSCSVFGIIVLVIINACSLSFSIYITQCKTSDLKLGLGEICINNLLQFSLPFFYRVQIRSGFNTLKELFMLIAFLLWCHNSTLQIIVEYLMVELFLWNNEYDV